MNTFVLGIETSCDETSAAVVKDGRQILSNVVLSSLHLHKPYNGVVPEIASRHHAELIDNVIRKAFRESGVGIGKIRLIAVTNGPGLIGALLVGLSAAKGLVLANKIPFVGINHIWAHLYASWMGIRRAGPKFPFVGLVVSGGHTNLAFVKDFDKYENLGQTTDDAAGEAFDKVAKILKLGYPGGPVIEKIARRGDSGSIRFPKSLLDENSMDFSFSGIKTAVLYYVRKIEAEGSRLTDRIPDICASFQEAVIDVIVKKSVRACLKSGSKALTAGGGVVMNSRLRRRLAGECKKFKIDVHFPARGLCMDNAAMIAGLGYQLYKKGYRDNLDLGAFSSMD